MSINELSDLFSKHKAQVLNGRYITLKHITPLLNTLGQTVQSYIAGYSVENKPIHVLKIGTGNTNVLLWSQMHGNESTTTKALFDLLNVLTNTNVLDFILKQCTLTIVPILNPDGAAYYTRLNANKVDLNRDAQDLSQPESKVLRNVFNTVKPHFCFNLHGQRTIFGVGNTNKSAIVSFLSPAEDENRTVTPNRTVAMSIISAISNCLQNEIPNHIGRYDDAFNLNCVGDTFQSLGVPTVLFEAGHYPDDYERETVRRYIYIALIKALLTISNNQPLANAEAYFTIPNNEKTFYDIIIRHATLNSERKDVAIQYEEQLINDVVIFVPKVNKIGDLTNYFGHWEVDGHQDEVCFLDKSNLNIGDEIDFVLINTKKTALKFK